jgi:hypothetical protein
MDCAWCASSACIDTPAWRCSTLRTITGSVSLNIQQVEITRLLRYLYLSKRVTSPCVFYDRITTQSRVLETLTVPQLVKFPTFYVTRRLITAFTLACHLTVSWVRSIRFILPFHFLKNHFNIIFSSTPRSSGWSLSIRPPDQNPVGASSVSHSCHISTHLILLHSITRIIFGKQYWL